MVPIVRRGSRVGELSPEEIRTIRERCGWPRKRMAAYMRLSVGTIRAWESPTNDPMHRKPNGAAVRLLLELQRRIFNGEDMSQVY